MSKKVSFGREAQDKLLKGLRIATDAVGGTLGPSGRNVFIQDAYGSRIINDGVAIANKIVLQDPEEDQGAYIIRNVCSEQLDKVGDGTTTVAVLTEAIITACLARPENPMLIRKALNEAVVKVYDSLKSQSTPITKDDIERVALISCEDPALAKIISEVVGKLGEGAVITVEDSKTLETTYEVVDGYEAPVGFASPYMVTDTKTGKATFVDVPVLVTDRKISNVADIKPLFELLAKAGLGQCVLVCDDIDDSMLGIFVVNKMQGKFNALVIKAHGSTLKDIEGAVGATMVSASSGVTFQNITLEHLGQAKKVVSDQHKTLFLGDGVSAHAYADILEKELDNEPNQYLKEKLNERIAQLRGGIAVLRIAANTDFEREYLKLKAEDAVKAVQAALAEGVVPGGGLALWNASQELKTGLGEEILRKALQAPYRKISENSGADIDEPIVIGPEVIDPTKVERLAVANAVSAASTFITSFCLITDIPDAQRKN